MQNLVAIATWRLGVLHLCVNIQQLTVYPHRLKNMLYPIVRSAENQRVAPCCTHIEQRYGTVNGRVIS